MTSNLEQKDCVGFSKRHNNSLEEVLSKEFLGRFDAIVSYKSITKEIAEKFIKLKTKENSKINIEEFLKESEYEKYGLRNISLKLRKLAEDLQTN